MADLDEVFQQLHDDGVIDALEDVQDEDDYFTAAHVARYLPSSDAIETPHEAHKYIDELTEEGYVDEVETDIQKTVRYRLADDYDDLLDV
jgi:hypothetical protein